MERIATCHWGALRATASGDPEIVIACHCQACQRRTGTAMHVGAYYPRDRVRLDGPAKIYTRKGTSQFDMRFHFCPDCGTSVAWISDRNLARIGVAVGCFADPNFPAPAASVWGESKHSWVGLPADTKCYQQARV